MMKKIFLYITLLMACTMAEAQNQLKLEDVSRLTLRSERIQEMTPLANGEDYACLEDGRIISYSYKTGKQVAVLFDCNNTVGEKVSEIDGFEMSPDGQKMLVYNNVSRIYRRSFTANYYIYNIASKKLSKLSDYGKQQSPVWSPDGEKVAFVRDNNIFVIKLLYDNAESQITMDGKRNSIINGIPDWVNEEEFGWATALCFTADGSQVCWLKYDETDVPEYQLQMFKGLKPEREENSDYPHLYEYKYPKAGQKNAVMSAWSYDLQSHKVERLQLPIKADDYVCRLMPTDNASSVLFVTLNRHQDDMKIYSVNPRSTVAQMLISDTDKKYITEEEYGQMILSGGSILLLSDRDGNRHIYVYSATSGTLQRSVCPNGIDITSIYGIDANGDIYYQAAPTPMTRKIYVAHKNGKIDCLSQQDGYNDAMFAKTMKYYVNTFSNVRTPYIYTVNNAQGKPIATLQDNKKLNEKLKGYNLPKPEFFKFTTQDGIELNGWMVKPAGFDASKKYPVIMHQYSGPGSQQVLDRWGTGSMGEGAIYDAYLAQQGFIVVTVDGRGTGARGADFEKCTYLKIGELESHDQVETAIWLGKQSYVDKERIGIWGWSYGGFNTLMSMSEGRPVFACGVAIAPPTNWKFYDTVYTERYMRTPNENPEGYAINPIQRVSKLHGALLLCHGLADDNVHPQNTFEYSEALVQADKDFREIIYTNRNHSIYGGNTRTHLLRQVTDHFKTNLLK